MKLTWNKKGQSSNKRPFAVVSRYPNLPFEEHIDEAVGVVDINDREGDVSSNQESGSKTLALDEDSTSDPRKLAKSFQTEGDKLAEVIDILIDSTSFNVVLQLGGKSHLLRAASVLNSIF